MSANPTAHRLGREIAAVLVLKVVALTLLYFLFFDASRRQHVSPDAVAHRIFARG